ncbi:hypothetical protein M9Y10_035858 [Tritrichomonas musculus]|uniref:Ankyrin n=1 Tax=Tritrichomonas musculus TaxID=1915356 RepID=A0ABR2GWZ9_9EUKA
MFINYDHTIFTKFYFTNKNDPMIKDKKYYSNISILIQKVIKNGNVEIFDLFINDFDVNNKLFNEENETALHVAVKCGKYDIVKYLLEKKLNVNVNEFIYGGGGHGYGGDGIGNGQKNALHIAIQNEDVKIVDLLLKNDKINVNKKFINEIINNNRINFDVKELTPFHRCGFYDEPRTDDDDTYVEVYSRDQERTRIYRGGGAKTPLFAAIELNDVQMIKILLSHPEIDVNAKSICYSPYKKSLVVPLYEAVRLKNDEIQQLLMSNEKIDVGKVSSFYEEKNRGELENKRVFLLKCEKLPFENHNLPEQS